MPQLTIEYSANIETFDPSYVLNKVIEAMVATGDYEELTIKGRVHRDDVYQIGTAATGRAFVAARVGLLPGRSDEQKSALTKLVSETIAANRHWPKETETQITTEIYEIDGPSYHKVVKTT